MYKTPLLRVAGLLLAVGAALAVPAVAGDLPMAKPAEVGMDPAGLEKLAEAMHQIVDDGELAGVVTMVARHGKVVLFDAYGKQDLEKDIPMAKDTIMRIYSMTKPIAGVALMTLYEEGKFKLEDPVEEYIPQFKGLKVAKADGENGQPIVEDADHPMTIRELVSHTGGLTYGLFSRSQVDTMYVQANVLDLSSSLKEMVDKLGKIPLRQQPGTEWHYSVSVDVQGYLVEVLTGQPFDEVLKERIFEPLGMKDTDFWVPKEKQNRFSPLYVPNREGKLEAQPGDEYLSKPGLFSGGGGLVSTASDYMRFAQMVLNGGELDGVRILKPETVELMHTNQLPPNIPFINPMIGNPGNTFGIDFAIVEEPDGQADHPLAKGEFWWYGVGGTWFGINPIQDTVVVGMIQLRGGGAPRKARFVSKRLAYEAITDPVTP